jgi:hypothetical protein
MGRRVSPLSSRSTSPISLSPRPKASPSRSAATRPIKRAAGAWSRSPSARRPRSALCAPGSTPPVFPKDPSFAPKIGMDVPAPRASPIAPSHLVVQSAVVSIGLDVSTFAGHSLRAGFATSAARAGKPDRDIMKQTGHRYGGNRSRGAVLTSGNALVTGCQRRPRGRRPLAEPGRGPARWGAARARGARCPARRGSRGAQRGLQRSAGRHALCAAEIAAGARSELPTISRQFV